MKFNLRVVAYLLIYVAGTLFLTSRNASAITVIVFGLVTIGTIAAILSQNSAKRPPRRETRKPATSTDRDLRIAQDVQQALLNLPVPDVAGIKVAKYCKAATRIGGDFVIIQTHEGTNLNPNESRIPGVIEFKGTRSHFMGLGVGDVAGHGVPSALIMALCTGLFSDISAIEKTPGALLAKTNSQLSSLLIHSDIQYVTATYVMIYPTERRLVVARAGHPPAFIVHSNGETTDLNAEGTLLGMFPSEEYESVTYPLQSGDRVVLYTDGIIELRDNKGHELGIDFLKSAIISAGSKSIDEIIPAALTSYKGIDSATDDITLVVVEVS